MALIVLERVRYRYPDAAAYALDDINLEIDAGEFVLLAGASGSGKSTLCRLLNGLIPHFHGGTLEGSVRVDGLDTRAHRVHELFMRVGLVFQNPDAQLFNSTVARELAFGLESLGLPRDEIRARVEWALAVAHLTHLRDRAPHSLSGGEQQTVALAAILALRPRVLVLDEPFANLDPEAVARLRALLRDLHARGTTIVLAEHRLHTTIQDATRLVVLDHGRVARDGVPREILRDDLADLCLNTPFVVRLARASGWRDVPLSVDEAIAAARAHGSLALPARRAGAPIPSSRKRLPLAEEPSWQNHGRQTLATRKRLPLAEEPSWQNHGRQTLATDAPRVIEMRDVSFERDQRDILHCIRFNIARGECVALIGKNGSGKTTLLKHLNALYQPIQGHVVVLGQETRHTRVSDLARHVGFVFQNPNDQLFKPTVSEEIKVAPRALNRLDRTWLNKLCDWFELRPLLDRSPFTLSEGEKKRVAFAAALATHPAVVALDEPTTGQDFAFRAALARLWRDLQNEGITIILATHDLEFAEEVASRWIVLADGAVVADAAPDTVMQDDTAMARAALHPTARFRVQQFCRGGMTPPICKGGVTPPLLMTNLGVRHA